MMWVNGRKDRPNRLTNSAGTPSICPCQLPWIDPSVNVSCKIVPLLSLAPLAFHLPGIPCASGGASGLLS